IIGEDAGNGITSGSWNHVIGEIAGSSDSSSGTIPTGHPTQIYPLTTGNGNTFLGAWAGLGANDGTLSNIVAIGHNATASASNRIVLGNASHTDAYVGGESGAALAHTLGVVGSGSAPAI